MAFTDEFMSNLLQNPNFYNPLYATERQKKAQEDYATALMKRSTEGATRPTGVIAAMLDQLTSNIYRNASLNSEQAQFAKTLQAGTEQNQTTQGGGSSYGGGVAANNADLEQPSPPPQNVATAGTMPKTLDQQRIAMLRGETGLNADGTPSLNVSAVPPGAPVRTASLNPLGPAGGSSSSAPPGAPAAGPVLPTGPAAAAPPTFDQRYAQAFPNGRGYNPAGNAWSQISPVGTPESRGLAAGIATPKMDVDVNGNPVAVSPMGGMQGRPVGGGAVPGIQRPIGITGEGATTTYGQPAPGYGGGPSGIRGAIQQIVPLAEFARQQGAESKRVGGGAKAEAANIEQVVTQANTAREGIKNAGMMEDMIRSNPNQVFGPSAKSTNEFLRFVQGIPGVGELVDAKTLAGSDAIEKLNLALAGSLQAKLGLNPSAITIAMGSSPGNEKSRQGTLDLLGIVKQGFARDHYIATTLYQKYQNNLADYPKAIDDYIHNNPLKNPNTGHLVMDPVPIQNPADEKRMGLKSGTPVLLPDGRHGWVP